MKLEIGVMVKLWILLLALAGGAWFFFFRKR